MDRVRTLGRDLMKFVKIDPPGTFCFNEAVMEILQKQFAGRERDTQFIEVGCGDGGLSRILCEHGYRGAGIDFSKQAIDRAKIKLNEYVESGNYRLIHADFMEAEALTEWHHSADLVFSMMVMEHVDNESLFIENLLRLLKPGGYCLLAVPGRKDSWGYEDETVGHLRRYDREDLQAIMERKLAQVEIWSVGVPVVNLLYGIGNFLIKRSDERKKRDWSLRKQTEASGLQEVPFKNGISLFFQADSESYHALSDTCPAAVFFITPTWA